MDVRFAPFYLHPETPPEGFQQFPEKKPDMMKFMGDPVKPTLAALLGEEQWTAQNPKGFGCFACHAQLK